MLPQKKISVIQKMEQAIRRDPKRFSLLGGLLVIMLFLWGRMLFSGPASATAIRRSVVAITDSPQPTVRVAASNPVLDWLAQPKKAVQRNLFAVNLDYFSRAGDKTKPVDPDPGQAVPDDADHEQQILLENLRQQSAKLKLESTMMGSTPRAMVNGVLVREGDTVEGFVVVKIQSQQITVEQDGVTLQVGMP